MNDILLVEDRDVNDPISIDMDGSVTASLPISADPCIDHSTLTNLVMWIILTVFTAILFFCLSNELISNELIGYECHLLGDDMGFSQDFSRLSAHEPNLSEGITRCLEKAIQRIYQQIHFNISAYIYDDYLPSQGNCTKNAGKDCLCFCKA
jgi:hypothetical protein